MLGDDPAGSLRALRAERTAAYEQAQLRIDTNGKTIDAIADQIAHALQATA